MAKTIACLISHVPNPRAYRRVEGFARTADVMLLYWNKGGISCDIKELEGVKQEEIHIPANRINPIKRILPTFMFAIRVVRRLLNLNPDIIYAERFDMLVVAWLYSMIRGFKTKIIFEIPDLQRLMVDEPRNVIERIIKFIISCIEKMIYKRVSLLIITSNEFYEKYYFRFFKNENVLFIPNIPDLTPFLTYNKKAHGKFTVGFFGVVRYFDQLKMLLEIAGEININVIIAGFSEINNEIEEICKQMDNAKYLGKFNYDKDIAFLYGQCDCVFSVYDAGMKNVRVALPNKLYEAIYCELPIIVAKNTYLSELVQDMGVGIAVSHNEKGELKEALIKLSTDKEFYNHFVGSCHRHRNKIELNIYNKKLTQATNQMLKE